jgi:hypothetical protein
VESREAVVRYLRGLADKELAELFYDAVRDRRSEDVPTARRHFVLGDASYEDGKWALDVIAREDPVKYEDGWVAAAPVSQGGVCEGCGTRIKSWAKHMVCSVCGSKAYGS